MLETSVARSGIDYRCQSQLVDSVKTLKKGMLYDIIQQPSFDFDKPENGVVYNLMFIHKLIDNHRQQISHDG